MRDWSLDDYYIDIIKSFTLLSPLPARICPQIFIDCCDQFYYSDVIGAMVLERSKEMLSCGMGMN